MFLGCLLLLIHFPKTQKQLKESDEYLRYVIQGRKKSVGRIARELHDTVAQNIRYCWSFCEKDEAAANLGKISEILSKSLSEELTGVTSMAIRLSIIGGTDASFMNEDEIGNLYRIIQEALTNSIKYSGGEEVVILVQNENG